MIEPDDDGAPPRPVLIVEDEAWRIVAPPASTRRDLHPGRQEIPVPPLAPEIARKLLFSPPG